MKCFTLALLALTACGNDLFISVEGGISFGDGDAANDAASADSAEPLDARADASAIDASDGGATSDGGIDTGDACTTIYGQTACDGIMNSYCQALYNCNGGQTVQQCRAWFNANMPSYDCAAQKYKKQVCSADANKCNGDMPGFFCSKLMSNYPATLSTECGTFFGEF